MKGILMRPDMIQAIIEGRKTQTRRVIKPQPDMGLPEFERYSHINVGRYHPTKIDKDGEEYPGDEIFGAYTDDGELGWKPRYHIGETVFLQEAWMIEHSIQGSPRLDDHVTIHYNNSSTSRRWGDIIDNEAGVFLISVAKAFHKSGYEQTPMFMPEVLARHFIVIEQVRAERVQEITSQDCKAEGVRLNRGLMKTAFTKEEWADMFRSHFSHLWNTINPKYPWESNCWVFVYTFRLKGEDETE